MSLRPEELRLVCAEVTRELTGGVVQRVHAPTSTRIYLEVRVPGRSVTLLLCSDKDAARLSAVEVRPDNPPRPPAWQSVLRTSLVGAKLADAEALPGRRTAILHFTKSGAFVNVILELGSSPVVVVCGATGVVKALSIPSREGLRVGQPWTPLEEQPVKDLASRLQGEHVHLRLAFAAEALLAQAEHTHTIDARRAPLVARLKKLERTQDKVRAEAGRTDKALAFRREGELLTQNLARLRRGQPSITVTEYLDDGSTREVVLPLDPKRSPQQEVAHRFHQYKRMLRGADIATQRLAVLAQEHAALEAQLAALQTAIPAPEAARLPPRRPNPQQALPPYREYVAHGGQKLWVGRGAVHNDTLTFHVARPFHVWLHARGLPGAHVVVPLEKNATLHGEVLIDAAHLAAHHSDAKGEPRVEISYTPVKFVRKPKDAPPGAVTFTREKTLLLRLEPQRLQRLLATASD